MESDVFGVCLGTRRCIKCGNTFTVNELRPMSWDCPHCKRNKKESERIINKVKRRNPKVKRVIG